jgi:hypothetical protein
LASSFSGIHNSQIICSAEMKVTYFYPLNVNELWPQEFLIGIQDYCEISVEKRPGFSQNATLKMLQIYTGIDEYNILNTQIQRWV